MGPYGRDGFVATVVAALQKRRVDHRRQPAIAEATRGTFRVDTLITGSRRISSHDAGAA
jgi:hypothetical protein